MKLRFITLVSLLTWVVCMVADSYFNVAYTNVTGAPTARCGSVADPNTCITCHTGGPNTIQPGWITSDVPLYGYVPGTTYTITATATYVGRNKFGFEISPQDPSSLSTTRGTCIITDTSGTKLITGSSGRKYVTHKLAGTTGTMDGHTWTFDWTAPTTGRDSVIFYGAFLCTNSSSSSSGDITYRSSLTVYRDPTSGIEDQSSNVAGIVVYPNPASGYVNVRYKNQQEGRVEIILYDLQGRMIASLLSESKAPGDYTNVLKFPFILNAGVYFLKISMETGNVVKRFLVQQ